MITDIISSNKKSIRSNTTVFQRNLVISCIVTYMNLILTEPLALYTENYHEYNNVARLLVISCLYFEAITSLEVMLLCVVQYNCEET